MLVIPNLPIQVLAGDSMALSISCTIPAIPGVNAPLDEEINVEPAVLEEKETQTPSHELKDQEERPLFIEELQGTQLAQGITSELTKVIYSR
jgi:hypothetical protein